MNGFATGRKGREFQDPLFYLTTRKVSPFPNELHFWSDRSMYVCTEYKYIKGYTLLMYIYIRMYVCVLFFAQ